LLDAKADVSAKDEFGRAALMLAKQNGHEEAARLFENR
jgi:ankyrin repeat protein